jgi:hypothetical protein
LVKVSSMRILPYILILGSVSGAQAQDLLGRDSGASNSSSRQPIMDQVQGIPPPKPSILDTAGRRTPAREPLIDSVERESDRTRGYITDEATWQLDRLDRDRDIPFGRATRHNFERFMEERDRQLQLEQREERIKEIARRSTAHTPTLLQPLQYTYDPVAWVVEEDDKRLTGLRDTLKQELRDARTQRDRNLAAAKDAKQKAEIQRAYDARRERAFVTEERARERIIGGPVEPLEQNQGVKGD